MQPTAIGHNLTGAAQSPAAVQAMNDATDSLTPAAEVDTSAIEAARLMHIAEADAVGSVPAPASLSGVVKSTVAAVKGGEPTILLDKLGERLAFERTGTRLYDALIVKYRAAQQVQADPLPPASTVLDDDAAVVAQSDAGASAAELPAASEELDETPEETLARIRSEELEHFDLLCQAVRSLGGDPTAQTPCADVAAVASSGILQVLADPRTTLAQCLGAMLTAELTDNAGWELLIALADKAGETTLTGQFADAMAEERQHLAIVKNWLKAIVAEQTQPSLV
jgi:hypothetical protein